MPKISSIPLQIAVAFDQLLNTLCGGWADETLSARCFRLQHQHRGWLLARYLVDGLFFWQKGHCEAAWQSEKVRAHLPEGLR